MSTEIVTADGEVVPTTAPITLFGTDDPVAVVERASTIAAALADVIDKRQLFTTISGKKHVQVEGWTLLGSMLGVFAEIEWSRPIVTPNGTDAWEARAVARTLAGLTVGAADSMCSRDEAKWRQAGDYAVRSMAQTRAVSKALRMPLGFIMHLAGYSATPAEEIDDQTATQQSGAGRKTKPESGPVPAPAGPSLDQIKARLLEVVERHHISTARYDELIKEYVPANPDADTLKAKLIELGTDIAAGLHDPQEASGDAVAAEQMSAEEAIAAGAALVGKS